MNARSTSLAAALLAGGLLGAGTPATAQEAPRIHDVQGTMTDRKSVV